MRFVRSLPLALAVGGAMAAAACRPDHAAGPAGPAGPRPLGVAPSLHGIPLRPATLARVRRQAWGCLLSEPAGDGRWRTLALPYQLLPFALPRRALPFPHGGAPAELRHEVRRLVAGGPMVSILCTVPREMTWRQLQWVVNASAGPRWAPIARALARRPARRAPFAGPLPAEAIQARWELLGEDAGVMASAPHAAGAQVRGARTANGSEAGGVMMATRPFSPPRVAAACEEAPPPDPALTADPVPLDPVDLRLPLPSGLPGTSSPGTILTQQVRPEYATTCDGGEPSYGGYGDPYADYQGSYWGSSTTSDADQEDYAGPTPCYYDCETYEPPPVPPSPPLVLDERGPCPANDPACYQDLTARDSALIQAVIARHMRPEGSFPDPAAGRACHALLAQLQWLTSDTARVGVSGRPGHVFRGATDAVPTGMNEHYAATDVGTGAVHVDPKTLADAATNEPYTGKAWGEAPPSATDFWEKYLLATLLHEAAHTVQPDAWRHPQYDAALAAFRDAYYAWLDGGRNGAPPAEPGYTEFPFDLTSSVASPNACVRW